MRLQLPMLFHRTNHWFFSFLIPLFFFGFDLLPNVFPFFDGFSC